MYLTASQIMKSSEKELQAMLEGNFSNSQFFLLRAFQLKNKDIFMRCLAKGADILTPVQKNSYVEPVYHVLANSDPSGTWLKWCLEFDFQKTIKSLIYSNEYIELPWDRVIDPKKISVKNIEDVFLSILCQPGTFNLLNILIDRLDGDLSKISNARLRFLPYYGGEERWDKIAANNLNQVSSAITHVNFQIFTNSFMVETALILKDHLLLNNKDADFSRKKISSWNSLGYCLIKILNNKPSEKRYDLVSSILCFYKMDFDQQKTSPLNIIDQLPLTMNEKSSLALEIVKQKPVLIQKRYDKNKKITDGYSGLWIKEAMVFYSKSRLENMYKNQTKAGKKNKGQEICLTESAPKPRRRM